MAEKQEEQEKQGTYPIKWTELHCPGCGKYLGDYAIIWGKARYPCRKCKKPVTVGVVPDEEDQDDIEGAVRSGATYVQTSIDKPDGQ